MRSSIKTFSNKTWLLAALALASSSASAFAWCDNCSYRTYYQPVVVRHCVHVVPYYVYRPEVYTSYVPVVTYQPVLHTRYVAETYYSRYTSVERVPLGYDAGYRHYDGYRPRVYRDSSYGLDPHE